MMPKQVGTIAAPKASKSQKTIVKVNISYRINMPTPAKVPSTAKIEQIWSACN